MDKFGFPQSTVEDNESELDNSRLARWLGVPGPDAPAPRVATKGPAVQSDRSRLGRWLGVESTGDDRPRPVASDPGDLFGWDARRASRELTAPGPLKYAVGAVAVLTAGVLGLGALTFDLRSEVSSLKKAVAAESSTDADVSRQITTAEAELGRIDARLADVEGSSQDLGGIETRLAQLEKRFGRR